MNIDALIKQLMAVARANPPSQHVPYAFEKRVMAGLSSVQPWDAWTLWGRALWRAAGPSVAIMCATLVWSVLASGASQPDLSLAAQFENAVMAPLTQIEQPW